MNGALQLFGDDQREERKGGKKVKKKGEGRGELDWKLRRCMYCVQGNRKRLNNKK